MKRKGSSLIYVLLIMLPLMILIMVLASITTSDLKMNSNVINYNQAYYNAETGVQYGIKQVYLLQPSSTFNFYLDTSNDGIIYNTNMTGIPTNNYAQVSITYSSSSGLYAISSTGYYMGSRYTLTKSITGTPTFSLDRKLLIDKLDIQSGSIEFYVKPGFNKYLSDDERFLLSSENKNVIIEDEDGSINFDKSNGNSNINGIKASESSFFAFKDNVKLPHIEGPATNRWVHDIPSDIYYYVQKGNLTIGDDGGLLASRNNTQLKVLMVEGNLTLDKISKETAEEYFDNLVIYCTGTLNLIGCQETHPEDNKKNKYCTTGCFLSTTANGNGNDRTDLNISIMVDVIKITGHNVGYSYKDGNTFTKEQDDRIKNILLNNINAVMDWN